MLKMQYRTERQHTAIKEDPRTDGQRDRDRILYSAYFRRLAGVTQVISASEGQVFHNRLTHSLKVAQVARRIAEYALQEHRELGPDLDPDVVEAASLIHDLGHPPFGHIAEFKLTNLVQQKTNKACGYEGNAQSLRIVTKLDVNDEFDPDLDDPIMDSLTQRPGLNLSRATINACIKYPYVFDAEAPREGTPDNPPKKTDKWGVYQEELEVFKWARMRIPAKLRWMQTLEAQIMDWADDVAFSVHDTEDFCRAGLIPLDKLFREKPERRELEYIVSHPECAKKVDSAFAPTKREFSSDEQRVDALCEIFQSLAYSFGSSRLGPTRREISYLKRLKAYSSELLERLILGVKYDLEEASLHVEPDRRVESEVLKILTWRYVILNDALAHQQQAQNDVIEKLYDFYFNAIEQGELHKIPSRFHGILHLQDTAARLAADIVASLTDHEAYAQFQQISGMIFGSGLRGVVL